MSLPQPLHDGERAARAVRQALGVGETAPVADLVVLVEDQGALVSVECFGAEEIAGVLLRHEDGEALVAVNADHWPVRQRFTLAHELGHLQMDHTEGIDWASDLFAGRSRDPQEVEANYFAAEFLAPRAGILAWLERIEISSPRKISAETVARLAFHYGVSLPTTCFRLERAGAISPREKSRLLDEVKTVDWRALGLQPFSDTLQALREGNAYPRVPRQTVVYAKAAQDAKLIDDEEFAAIVGAHDDALLDESCFS